MISPSPGVKGGVAAPRPHPQKPKKSVIGAQANDRRSFILFR